MANPFDAYLYNMMQKQLYAENPASGAGFGERFSDLLATQLMQQSMQPVTKLQWTPSGRLLETPDFNRSLIVNTAQAIMSGMLGSYAEAQRRKRQQKLMEALKAGDLSQVSAVDPALGRQLILERIRKQQELMDKIREMAALAQARQALSGDASAAPEGGPFLDLAKGLAMPEEKKATYLELIKKYPDKAEIIFKQAKSSEDKPLPANVQKVYNQSLGALPVITANIDAIKDYYKKHGRPSVITTLAADALPMSSDLANLLSQGRYSAFLSAAARTLSSAKALSDEERKVFEDYLTGAKTLASGKVLDYSNKLLLDVLRGTYLQVKDVARMGPYDYYARQAAERLKDRIKQGGLDEYFWEAFLSTRPRALDVATKELFDLQKASAKIEGKLKHGYIVPEFPLSVLNPAKHDKGKVFMWRDGTEWKVKVMQ